jgi:hypothetical protein
MKTYFVFFLICISTQSFAQSLYPSHGLYPLQVGNLWQYQSPDSSFGLFETSIIGDSTLPNGKTYAICIGTFFGTSLMRQDSSKVYAIDFADSLEFVLFDFAASPKDTISHHMKGSRTIVLASRYTDILTSHTYWLFLDLQGNGPTSYDFFDWTISDSVGLTSLIMEPGVSYHMTGAIINGKTIGTIMNVQTRNAQIPIAPILYQNYPNPFNPETSFRFILPAAEYVNLKIYDLLGREQAILIEGRLTSGEHSISWNASSLPSGIYFYQLKTTTSTQTKKLLLLK